MTMATALTDWNQLAGISGRLQFYRKLNPYHQTCDQYTPVPEKPFKFNGCIREVRQQLVKDK